MCSWPKGHARVDQSFAMQALCPAASRISWTEVEATRAGEDGFSPLSNFLWRKPVAAVWQPATSRARVVNSRHHPGSTCWPARNARRCRGGRQRPRGADRRLALGPGRNVRTRPVPAPASPTNEWSDMTHPGGNVALMPNRCGHRRRCWGRRMDSPSLWCMENSRRQHIGHRLDRSTSSATVWPLDSINVGSLTSACGIWAPWCGSVGRILTHPVPRCWTERHPGGDMLKRRESEIGAVLVPGHAVGRPWRFSTTSSCGRPGCQGR
jgi:hypothetical protein